MGEARLHLRLQGRRWNVVVVDLCHCCRRCRRRSDSSSLVPFRPVSCLRGPRRAPKRVIGRLLQTPAPLWRKASRGRGDGEGRCPPQQQRRQRYQSSKGTTAPLLVLLPLPLLLLPQRPRFAIPGSTTPSPRPCCAGRPTSAPSPPRARGAGGARGGNSSGGGGERINSAELLSKTSTSKHPAVLVAMSFC